MFFSAVFYQSIPTSWLQMHCCMLNLPIFIVKKEDWQGCISCIREQLYMCCNSGNLPMEVEWKWPRGLFCWLLPCGWLPLCRTCYSTSPMPKTIIRIFRYRRVRDFANARFTVFDRTHFRDRSTPRATNEIQIRQVRFNRRAEPGSEMSSLIRRTATMKFIRGAIAVLSWILLFL